LVVVFSPALRDYVGHVLPSLGVTRVQVRTFAEWANERVRQLFPTLPHDVRETTPAVVHRLKLHPVLLAALERQVARVAAAPTPRQALDDWGSVLGDAALLEETVAASAPASFTADEIRRATDWTRREHERLSAWMEGDREAQAELDPEDHALLLRAWQLRVGPLIGRGRQPLRYRHIAIDEVQDFSPVEVRVLLGCLDERHSITLAGDTQQHITQDAGFTSGAFFSHPDSPAPRSARSR
jgi:DNA helicase-2/ATP-dependent DNA helicase PcrA